MGSGDKYSNVVGIRGADSLGQYVVLSALGRVGETDYHPHSFGSGTFGFLSLEDPRGFPDQESITRMSFECAQTVRRDVKYQRSLAVAHALSAGGFSYSFDDLGARLPLDCYISGANKEGCDEVFVGVPFAVTMRPFGTSGTSGTSGAPKPFWEQQVLVEITEAPSYCPGKIRFVQMLSGLVAPHPVDVAWELLEAAGERHCILRVLVGGPAGLASGTCAHYNFFMGDGDVGEYDWAARSDSSPYCSELISSAKPPETAFEAAAIAAYAVNELPPFEKGEFLDSATKIFICRSSGAHQFFPGELSARRGNRKKIPQGAD
ncbi:MAG: hypothetical protein V1820_05320 [archaeon]